MQAVEFDRDAMASWYAEQHLKADPGVREIYYLPINAPDREIRLVEVNELIGELQDEALQPLDFGVDRGADVEHTLLVLDVTPGQWERINEGQIALPAGWTLQSAVRYRKG